MMENCNCKIRVNGKTILNDMLSILELMRKAYNNCPSDHYVANDNICEAIGKISTLISILSKSCFNE